MTSPVHENRGCGLPNCEIKQYPLINDQRKEYLFLKKYILFFDQNNSFSLQVESLHPKLSCLVLVIGSVPFLHNLDGRDHFPVYCRSFERKKL